MSIEMDVLEYMKGERQWTRNCRYIHAKAELKKAQAAKDAYQVDFWSRVVEANTLRDQAIWNH